MQLPKPNKNEKELDYISRCASLLSNEDCDNEKKVIACLANFRSKDGKSQAETINEMDFNYCSIKYLEEIELGFEEELNEDNFYIPDESEYVSSNEIIYEEKEVEEWDFAAEKPGLWENIRKKKEREGKNYRPAKPGDKDRPNKESWKLAQSSEGDMAKQQIEKMHNQLMEIVEKMKTMDIEFEEWTVDMISKSELYIQNIYDFVHSYDYSYESEDSSDAKFKYEDPKTGEIYTYSRPGVYKKDDRILIPVRASEYQGRKVQLGKPFRTPDGPKKFSVYVKNDKGNVVKVNFGDPNMKIKKNIPERRKSFRARHNCDSPGPRWKARYWSCRAW
jgi:hypothetical protein